VSRKDLRNLSKAGPAPSFSKISTAASLAVSSPAANAIASSYEQPIFFHAAAAARRN
jgi:hypothetical protein